MTKNLVQPAGHLLAAAALVTSLGLPPAAIAQVEGTKPSPEEGVDLAARAKAEGKHLGRLTGARHRLSKRQIRQTSLPKGTQVLWQETTRQAILVEIDLPNQAPLTWAVTGAVARKYRDRGGPAGGFGLPSGEARCNLPDKGCLQTFAHGTIYARGTKTAATPVRGARGDIVAVARAEVGFIQQMRGKERIPTKYQRWANTPNAWCSIFLAWVANRAGHGEVIKPHEHFTIYRDWLRNSVKRIDRPVPGSFVIMNGAGPDAVLGHSAVVIAVSNGGRSLTIVEGNRSRRVREVTIKRARNMEFYWPY